MYVLLYIYFYRLCSRTTFGQTFPQTILYFPTPTDAASARNMPKLVDGRRPMTIVSPG